MGIYNNYLKNQLQIIFLMYRKTVSWYIFSSDEVGLGRWSLTPVY